MENRTGLLPDLRSITILFTAWCTGIILFTGVSLVINRIVGPFLHNPKFSQIYLGAVVTLTVICLFLAHSNYNKRVKPEQTMLSFHEKLIHYRSTLIKYMAFLEAPAILSIIGFLLTGYFRFLAITFILLLNIFLKRPSKMRIIDDMQLTSNEKSELYDR